MVIEIFNRQEEKYMLDDMTYRGILEQIEEHMCSDEYSKEGGFYSICNIYYDTGDDRLIRKSIDKPVYKEKLRLRTYGTPDSGSEAFVEIKKKYHNTVNKRRVVMPFDMATAYLNEGISPDCDGVNRQIFREIDYFRNFYTVVPKVYISYDRRAYFDMNDCSFRVTFDTNIRTRRTDVKLESGSYGQQLLEPDMWLMEVKISDAVPAWFCGVLSQYRLYPTSFSKYGEEYRRYLQHNIKKGEKTVCLNQSSTQQSR